MTAIFKFNFGSCLFIFKNITLLVTYAYWVSKESVEKFGDKDFFYKMAAFKVNMKFRLYSTFL